MDQMQYIKDLERALIIAYRALAEGAKAKREIIRVLKGRRWFENPYYEPKEEEYERD